MNLKQKIVAFGLSALVIAGSTLPIVATVPTIASENYTPVGVTEAQYPAFNKYLVMSAGDRTPKATFSYTIAPGTPRAAASGQMQVLAGLTKTVSGVTYPYVEDTSFASDQATTPKASATAAQIDVQRTDRSTVKLDAGEKFAVSSAKIVFANIQFPEPGIYRYVITEKANATNFAKGIVNDDDVDRILDVYVTDNGSGTLQVSSFVLHMSDDIVTTTVNNGSGDVSTPGAAVSDKTDGFTNEFFAKDLAFKQEVTGNQASRDKYFEYTVALTGLTPGDKYTVSLAPDSDSYTNDGSAHATIPANPNAATTKITSAVTQPTVLTVGSDGKITQKFYLNHGEHIVIRGLPQNANYNVTQDKEDYKQTAKAVSGYPEETSALGNTKIKDRDNNPTDDIVKTSYVNTRAGVIPTGVVMSIGAGLAVILAGGTGLGALKIKRRKKDDAEGEK